MTNRNALGLWQNNWSPLSDFQREFFGNWNAAALTEAPRTPACDVEESEDRYLISLEIPGVAKEDIQVETLGDEIVISGESRVNKERKDKGALISERRFGKFRRAFKIPTGFDSGKVEASYKDGVLHVALPKAETAQRRHIKIN